MMNDIRSWADKRLHEWTKDVAMRCEVADLSRAQRSEIILGGLIKELVLCSHAMGLPSDFLLRTIAGAIKIVEMENPGSLTSDDLEKIAREVLKKG